MDLLCDFFEPWGQSFIEKLSPFSLTRTVVSLMISLCSMEESLNLGNKEDVSKKHPSRKVA